jgi:hypothetical protein
MQSRITVRVEGVPKDGGDVRFSDFIKQLEAVRTALRHTERLVLKDEETEHNSVYYRVVDLRRTSPATVVLEAVVSDPSQSADMPNRVVGKFFSSLGYIREHGRIPEDFDLAAIEAYRDLGAGLKRNVAAIAIENGEHKFPIDREYEECVIKAIGPDELADGSIAGRLEKVNLHNTSRFEIFPAIGPQKVICDFEPELRAQVKAGLDQNIRVYGRLRYKHWDKFPYAINASTMEVYPDEDRLPSLFDLRGIAPQATGEMSTEQFIHSIRDVWS